MAKEAWDEWSSAAVFAVPWDGEGGVMDDLRQQQFLPREEKDTRAPSAEENLVLQQRRADYVELMLSRMPGEMSAMHDGLQHKDETALMRGVPFGVLNSDDHIGGGCGEVWAADVPNVDVSRRWFSKSRPCKSIDFFVSHAWDDDGNAKGMAGLATFDDTKALGEFGWRKAVAFQNVVRTIAEHAQATSESEPVDKNALLFWADKTCIPQFDQVLKTACIVRLEFFIRHSRGLVVLLNPRYVRRLWCIYEWACFLCAKHPSTVFINIRSFASDQNRTAYLQAVRIVSVDNCECQVEEDHSILRKKVNTYYKTEALFSTYVQCSMIALVVRDYLSYPPMIKTKQLYDQHVTPWIELANELGLSGLHAAFLNFDILATYAEVEESDVRYMPLLQKHLEVDVYPVLHEKRLAACTEMGLSLMQGV
jgi:hypothetical protein